MYGVSGNDTWNGSLIDSPTRPTHPPGRGPGFPCSPEHKSNDCTSTDLSGRSRSVVRWRVIKRLTDWRVLTPLPRRIGGSAQDRRVSAYTLDTAGLALLSGFALASHGTEPQYLRRPGLPGERFIRHVLTVSELYVTLVEASAMAYSELVDFQAEPDAWIPMVSGAGSSPMPT